MMIFPLAGHPSDMHHELAVMQATKNLPGGPLTGLVALSLAKQYNTLQQFKAVDAGTKAYMLGRGAGDAAFTVGTWLATDGVIGAVGKLPTAVGRSMQWLRGVKAAEDLPLASDRLQLEKLRTQYRQKASWVNPTEIKNAKLQKVVDNLYRKKASVGSGVPQMQQGLKKKILKLKLVVTSIYRKHRIAYEL